MALKVGRKRAATLSEPLGRKTGSLPPRLLKIVEYSPGDQLHGEFSEQRPADGDRAS